MIKMVCGVVILGLATAVAGCTQSNPLLGRWVLSSGDKGCNTAMVFTSKTQSFTWRGSTSSAPAAGYVVQKDKVIVGGTPGVIETFTYVFTDAKTISQPNMSGGCVWTRE